MLDRWLTSRSKTGPLALRDESDDSVNSVTLGMNASSCTTSSCASASASKRPRARSPPGQAPHEPPPSIEATSDPLAFSRDAVVGAEGHQTAFAPNSGRRSARARREAPADAPSKSPKGYLAPAADVTMIRAQSRRTSRQARPSDPSDEARADAAKRVVKLQTEIIQRGARFGKPLVFRESRVGGGTSKGSMVTAAGGAPTGHENSLTHVRRDHIPASLSAPVLFFKEVLSVFADCGPQEQGVCAGLASAYMVHWHPAVPLGVEGHG